MPTKKRLNNAHREDMLAFAVARVNAVAEHDKAVAAAYTKMLAAMRAAFAKKYPAGDMAVLKKYGLTHANNSFTVKIFDESGELVRVNLQGDDTVTDLPDNHVTPYRAVWLGAAAGKAVVAHKKAEDEKRAAERKVRADFRDLLWTCRTFDDAVEGWPPFAELRPKIAANSTALTTLGAETKARIRNYEVVKK